jgi:geranylgeranyl diphosphate synthase type I
LKPISLQKQGNDIREGKRTIILCHALQKTKGKDKQRLIEIMDKKREEISDEEIFEVTKMMENYGSIDYANKMLSEFSLKAKDYFKKELCFIANKPEREYIEYMPEFLAKREQ